MTSNDVLEYMRSAERPVYFRQIANYFPGDYEEFEVLRKVQWLMKMGKVRRLNSGRYAINV